MLSVVKVGGSVLRDAASFAAVAEFIERRLASRADERIVVVVSAEYGTTDALLEEAHAITSSPSPEALDLLWSTGETRSVARLSLHLQRLGISAEPLNVHQSGIVSADGRTTVRPLRVLAVLAHARVAIVPGFLAVRAGGAIRSLGRGGSDLTAVVIADRAGRRPLRADQRRRRLLHVGPRILLKMPGRFATWRFRTPWRWPTPGVLSSNMPRSRRHVPRRCRSSSAAWRRTRR